MVSGATFPQLHTHSLLGECVVDLVGCFCACVFCVCFYPNVIQFFPHACFLQCCIYNSLKMLKEPYCRVIVCFPTDENFQTEKVKLNFFK